jgi:hypothetical protein
VTCKINHEGEGMSLAGQSATAAPSYPAADIASAAK